MNTKRVTGWSLALLMAVILPVSGLVSSCSTPEAEQTGETAESGSSNGLVQEVSADDMSADRVARVTFFDGGVAARPVGAEEWETLEVNEPLFEGYEVYAEEDAHAELMLGEAKYARFGEGADVTISRLDPEFAQFELGTGVMTLALDDWSDGEYYEISTPAGAFIPQQAGSYRVDVLPTGETRIGVLRGTAIVTTPEGQFTVNEGDAITLPYGEPAQVDVVSGGYASYYDDDWDDWSYQRDVHYETYYTDYDYPEPISAFSARNDIYGIAQLAAFGIWAALDDDDDRYVWRPHVARNPGWTPYSDGYWDYTPVTGWTWISREEWGWAPYHYGRWDYRDDYGWYWAPDHGQRISTVSLYQERYRWYPSQVYFYQPQQQNTYVYVPLAPGEPYIPYGYSSYYEPTVQVYDFRPRHINRAVYYVVDDDLTRRNRPRRADRDDLARFVQFADEQPIPIAKLRRPDRIVAVNEIAPERIRPPKDTRDRAVVVSERALERKAQRANRRAENVQVADRREVRKAEKRELKVNRRQLQANEQVQPVRASGRNKAERARAQQQPNVVDQRQNRGNVVERQKQRAERMQRVRTERRQQPKAERQQQRLQQQPKVDRQQRRAERQQQRQQAPRAERQQLRQQRRAERQQAPRVERQQRQQAPRAERQQLRQQRRAERQQQRSVAPRASRQDRGATRVAPQQRQQIRANRQAQQPKAQRQIRQQTKQAGAQKKAARRAGRVN
jgi:hypothetical protein